MYIFIDEIAPCQSHSIIGWMSLILALSEIAAMLVADKFLNYFGSKISILIFLAFAIRLGGYYVIPRPFFYLPLETMQFFNYGLLYVFITRTAKAIGTVLNQLFFT